MVSCKFFCKVVGDEAPGVLATYLEEVEKRKSATGEEFRETELWLQKEIEQVRLEVESVKLSIIKVDVCFLGGVGTIHNRLTSLSSGLTSLAFQPRTPL